MVADVDTVRPSALPIVDGPVVERVVLVDWIERNHCGQLAATSLPGHLVQITISGRVQQESEGRAYTLEPGMVVWYHDDELVRSNVLEAPWVFCTANFVAPTLSPPPFDQRVKPLGLGAIRPFEELLNAWRDATVSPAVRHMRVLARLLGLLADLRASGGSAFRMDPATRLWWEAEAQIRNDLSRPIDLRTIHRLVGRSQRTIIRSCHSAVGMAPMKRVKAVRMSMARGLVLYSKLPFSEVARRVGYGRVQEFSRDYRKHFGIRPTDDRAAGPDYRTERTRPERGVKTRRRAPRSRPGD
jgi:AraC-like DNA-binding protein